MTMTITKTTAILKQAVADADLNLNQTLATRELRTALEKGVITKAQRDVLTSVGAKAGDSNGGLQTSNYGRWLNRYAQAAVAADQAGNGNGTLEPGEANSAPDTFRAADGTTLRSVRTVLTKLAKVAAEPPAAFDASVAAAKLAVLYESFSTALTPLDDRPEVIGLKRFNAPAVTVRTLGYSDTVDSAVGYIDPANEQVFFNVKGKEVLDWENISSPFSEWYSVPFAKVQ